MQIISSYLVFLLVHFVGQPCCDAPKGGEPHRLAPRRRSALSAANGVMGRLLCLEGHGRGPVSMAPKGLARFQKASVRVRCWGTYVRKTGRRSFRVLALSL
jgi:hypothetical protein